MHWLDQLSEPAELRLCIKNLVALSALPSLWTRLTTLQMCESVTGTLLSMCDAEIVYLRLTEPGGQLIAEAAQTRLGPATASIPALGRSLGPWTGVRGKDSGKIANPLGSGKLTVDACRIGSGQGALIACAATAGFPRPAQRLLLEVAADEIAIAMLQREAEETETRFRATVERSTEFIGIADIGGHMGYLNPAGRSLVGAGRSDDLRGTSMLDYVANGHRELLSSQILPQALRAGRWSGELALHHRITGAAIPVAAEVFTVEHPRSGAPMSIATVSRSISEAELSIREMRLSNEELAARVARQGAELAGLSNRLRADASGREGAEAQLRAPNAETGLLPPHAREARGHAIHDAAARVAVLSQRERQVLAALTRGDAHKVIAYDLGISVRTVEVHSARMLRRLGVPNLAHAIALAAVAELNDGEVLPR